MSENDIIGYVFEPSDYEALRNGSKLLFGDGTHFTPDQRRDLANMLHEVIGRAVEVKSAQSSEIDMRLLLERIHGHFNYINGHLTMITKLVEKHIKAEKKKA